MHPGAVVSHSSRSPHHHHFGGRRHHDDPRPPPYNPYVDEPEKDYDGPMEFHNRGYEPSQPWVPAQVPTVVITNQPHSPPRMMNVMRGLPHHDTTVTCPNCNGVVATRVVHKNNCKTHLWALCLCVFLCWPCVCVPYCKNSCRTADHFCTRCDSYLGDSHNG